MWKVISSVLTVTMKARVTPTNLVETIYLSAKKLYTRLCQIGKNLFSKYCMLDMFWYWKKPVWMEMCSLKLLHSSFKMQFTLIPKFTDSELNRFHQIKNSIKTK